MALTGPGERRSRRVAASNTPVLIDMNAEATRLFLSQQNSEHTRATYARGLAVFFAFVQDKAYSDVTDTDVVAFKESLSGFSSATQFTRWTACRSFFTWLVKSGRLPFSPFETVKAPKLTKNATPRVPTDADYTRLLRTVPLDEPRDWRDKAILHALGNGLRCGEVVALTLGDYFYSEADSAYILRVTGKGDKERLVPAAASTSEVINEWLLRRVSESDRVFCDGHIPMTVRQVQSAVTRASKRTRVKGVHPHSLRHHYATRLIRAGASVFSVQSLLGHDSVATTQRYVTLDMSDRVIASRLDPMG